LKFPPSRLQHGKVIQNYLADFPPIFGPQSKGKSLRNVTAGYVNPILAFHAAFPGVDMHRFAAFVGIEEKPPSVNYYDRWHTQGALPIAGIAAEL
jgi:hypothetical protein